MHLFGNREIQEEIAKLGTVPNSYGTLSETVTGQPRSKLLDLAHHETVPFRTMKGVPPINRRLFRRAHKAKRIANENRGKKN